MRGRGLLRCPYPRGTVDGMPSERLHAIELLGRVPYGRLATSMRALPFLAVARHIVIDDHVVLRMHSGLGFHDACDGSVIAYGADNLNTASPASAAGGPGTASDPGSGTGSAPGPGPASPAATSPATGGGEDLWSVQFTGPAEIVHPCPEQRQLFGTAPAVVNGEPFDPVYIRLRPHFITMHTLDFHASPQIRHTE